METEQEKQMNKHLCEGCTKCCGHISVEIDAPENKKDYSNIIWFVIHENIEVFIDDEDCWHLEVFAPCKMLDEKGLCKIYDERPEICRDYSQDNCEKNGEGDYYKFKFKCREDVIDYMRKHTKIKITEKDTIFFNLLKIRENQAKLCH